MDTKKVLNSILLVRKPSLDRKLTLYFLIFGLVVGYASFLDSVISASKEFLSSVACLVQSRE